MNESIQVVKNSKVNFEKLSEYSMLMNVSNGVQGYIMKCVEEVEKCFRI